jgi:exodeoxyribonuclease VII large subunit
VEDLWTFNEEPVVRAGAASRVPVISAVGHESDTTLCDYVADFRAGTPSIAAERAVPVKADLVARVRELSARIEKAPQQSYESFVQRVDDLSFRLGAHLKQVASTFDCRLNRIAPRLAPAMTAAYQRAESRLKTAATSLRHLSPYGVLERGYSITLNAEGRVVRGVEGLAPGTRLTTRLGNGTATSVVEAVSREGERLREPQREGAA